MSNDTTRERILLTASDEFAAKGFDRTTVRDICTRADVNVSAVNYHFRDKLNLYHEVLTRWIDDFMEKTGLGEDMATSLPAAEKLHRYIRAELSYLCKANDPDGHQLNQARQILQELTSGTHNPELFHGLNTMEEQHLHPVISELLGGSKDQAETVDAAMAATSLTIHYFLRALDDPKYVLQTEEDLDRTADFLATFALGGLKAIKESMHA